MKLRRGVSPSKTAAPPLLRTCFARRLYSINIIRAVSTSARVGAARHRRPATVGGVRGPKETTLTRRSWVVGCGPGYGLG